MRGVDVGICDRTDVFCGRCEIMGMFGGLFPVGLIVYINTYEWNRYSSSLKMHTTVESHVYNRLIISFRVTLLALGLTSST